MAHLPDPVFSDEETARRSLRGIALLLVALVVFTCQDVITTHLARNYPVPFFLMIRYWVFAVAASIVAARADGGFAQAVRSRSPKLQIFRALLLIAEMGMFALALRYLKLVELHALFAATPLIVTALSVPFLGEQVGWRRWLAVLVGFAGVLIILRPGIGVFQPAAILGVAIALMYAVYTVMTKHVSRGDTFATTYWYTAFFGAIALSAIGPFFWVSPASIDWLWIATLCVSGLTGHYCFIKALEYAPASVLQPLTYLQLVGVTVLGYFFFAEVPDVPTVLGALIIVASGLYIIWREQVRKGAQ